MNQIKHITIIALPFTTCHRELSETQSKLCYCILFKLQSRALSAIHESESVSQQEWNSLLHKASLNSSHIIWISNAVI